jgi:hypothetical protein
MAPRTFAVATSVQDPLIAERLVAALREKQLDAFSRAGGAASAAAFASASPAFWDVLVPSEALEQAEGVIREVLDDVEAHAEENARAAEEEEEALSGEHPLGG